MSGSAGGQMGEPECVPLRCISPEMRLFLEGHRRALLQDLRNIERMLALPTRVT
jgi:hypothetical protein